MELYLSNIKKEKYKFYSLNFLLASKNAIKNESEEVFKIVSSSNHHDARLPIKMYYKKISTII